jgi:hypothetical protein
MVANKDHVFLVPGAAGAVGTNIQYPQSSGLGMFIMNLVAVVYIMSIYYTYLP